jgi:hypothetical protein
VPDGNDLARNVRFRIGDAIYRVANLLTLGLQFSNLRPQRAQVKYDQRRKHDLRQESYAI